MTTAAEAAQEYRHRIGQDISLSDGLDPEFLEDAPEDVDERWEREGRREMHATLFADWQG